MAVAASASFAAGISADDLPDSLRLAVAGGLKAEKKFEAKAGLTGWVMSDQGNQLIVFTTKDSQYVFAGNLMDASGKNWTKAYEEEHFTKPDFSKYWSDVENTKWIAEGASDADAKATIYAFTDPNCPYCHSAWEMVQPYLQKGLQVRWITVGILGPSSQGIAAQILSADDPLKAHLDHNSRFTATRGGKGIEATPEIAKTLKSHTDLMRALGLSGTPGFVYKDAKGNVIASAGLPSASAFEAMTGIK